MRWSARAIWRRWAHLPNLQKLPGVKLRAVHSANGARGKSYAKRFGADYCCTDYEEILSDPAIDVVLIASRNQYHASQALRGACGRQACICREADGADGDRSAAS